MTDPLQPELGAALTAWGDRVRANAAQVERYREAAPRADPTQPLINPGVLLRGTR